jgi:hypothetical protein
LERAALGLEALIDQVARTVCGGWTRPISASTIVLADGLALGSTHGPALLVGPAAPSAVHHLTRGAFEV